MDRKDGTDQTTPPFEVMFQISTRIFKLTTHIYDLPICKYNLPIHICNLPTCIYLDLDRGDVSSE